MATLGSSKWGIQISFDDTNNNTTTKTINGLDLHDIGDDAAQDDTWNATAAENLSIQLMRLTTNTLNGTTVIRTRPVENG